MEKQEITPYRMQTLMDVAAKVTKMMVNGVWHLTFDEMDFVLNQVRHGMQESVERNEKIKEEQACL